MRTVWLTASVDTEEDQWVPSRRTTVGNLRSLPGVGSWLQRRGIRCTYFVTQCVAEDPHARDALARLVHDGVAEVGAHLHPWNTRPFDPARPGEVPPAESLLTQVPDGLQLDKLRSLTESLTRSFGRAPRSFRAGRWALGPGTVRALETVGYAVDSSVMPGISWAEYGGPSYVGAERGVHRLDASRIGRPSNGRIVEVPVSVGFTRRGYRLWDRVQAEVLARPAGHPLSSFAYRSGAREEGPTQPRSRRTRRTS